ncbi:MAG TPA: HAD family hydrolase [candidate division Zixibacteria bacterium]|nr:HAD family hydrolase [candidate division Zixibacteria bacterium]
MNPANLALSATNKTVLEQLSCTKENQDIKGIIFDFDGVLSSFVERIGWPILSSALMVKPDLSREQINDFSLTALDFLTTLEKKPKNTSLFKLAFNIGKQMGMTNFQALKFVFTTGIMYAKARKTIVPTTGVRDVLRILLAENYKVILVTNTSWGVINKAIEKIPELEKFDLILTRDDVDKIKPDASGFIKAIEILDLKAHEVITVGDQASDIIAGKRAGMKTIAIYEKHMAIAKPHLKAQNPDFLIRDLKEIPNILRYLRDCIIEDIRTTIDLTEKSLQEFVVDYNNHRNIAP